MGLEAGTAAIISSLIGAGGAGLAAGLSDSGIQEKRPFTGAADPQNILSQLMGRSNTMFSGLAKNLAEPVTLRTSYAQPVPGLSGVDPAFLDQGLLSLPGLDLGFNPPKPPGGATPRQRRHDPSMYGGGGGETPRARRRAYAGG